jgi:hypothetical protein
LIYRCGIIEESLENKEILHELAKYLVKQRVQDMPEDTEKIWHINEYHLPKGIIETVCSRLQKLIKKSWYIHAFNEQENVMYVVLRNKYFKLPVRKDESWEEMIEYGLSVGIERKWTENIPASV